MNIGPFGCLASLLHAMIFTVLEGIGFAIVVAIILKVATGSVEQTPFVSIMAVILGILFLLQLVNALAASEAMATEAKERGMAERGLRLHGGANLGAIQDYEEQFPASTLEAARGRLVGTDKIRRAMDIPDDEEPWVTRLSMRLDGAFDCYVQFDRRFWSGNASNEFLQSLEQKVLQLAEAQVSDPPPDHGEKASQLQVATVRILDLHRRVFESARLRDANGVSQYFKQIKSTMSQIDELRG